ncbi:FAD-binding protein [Mycobacterium sp. DL592]|uniref:FAD-binding protein n=1 Tax=Mycobacterium sp. DL592 TaxID=2675524 RepID=UPI00142221AE|nr:FAD-binding protein [Mycobacterium sp. DL592]
MTADDNVERFSNLYWDDVVDVICAGSGPGALAHAILCADLGLSVVFADAVSPADLADEDTLEYLQAMIDDLGSLPRVPGNLELPLTRAVPEPPVTPKKGKHATIAPFVGSRLRDWALQCAVSPFGVIYSGVPDGMIPMRSESGTAIRAAVLGGYRPNADRPGPALAAWLAEQAREREIEGDGAAIQRLVFEDGRVAGAAIEGPSGVRLVRALEGVALSTGPMPGGAEWPAQPELRDIDVQVAIVSRSASRFGRVELLQQS